MSRSTKSLPAESYSRSAEEAAREATTKAVAIRAWREDRAASEAAYAAAMESIDSGARVTPIQLAALCSTVASATLAGWRVWPMEHDELRSMLMAEAMGKTRAATMERATRRRDTSRRCRLDATARLFEAPYGTPSADRRVSLLAIDASRQNGASVASMPRIGDVAKGADVGMQWLNQRARFLCLTAQRGGATGDANRPLYVGATAPDKMPRKIATPPRWNAAMDAASVADAIVAIDGRPIRKSEMAALRVAIDREPLTDVAVDLGWTYNTAKGEAKTGRKLLRARLTDRPEDDATVLALMANRLHEGADRNDPQTRAWHRIAAAIRQQADGRPMDRSGAPCNRWNAVRLARAIVAIRRNRQPALMLIGAAPRSEGASRMTVYPHLTGATVYVVGEGTRGITGPIVYVNPVREAEANERARLAAGRERAAAWHASRERAGARVATGMAAWHAAYDEAFAKHRGNGRTIKQSAAYAGKAAAAAYASRP